jgi:hypothetical protein
MNGTQITIGVVAVVALSVLACGIAFSQRKSHQTTTTASRSVKETL